MDKPALQFRAFQGVAVLGSRRPEQNPTDVSQGIPARVTLSGGHVQSVSSVRHPAPTCAGILRAPSAEVRARILAKVFQAMRVSDLETRREWVHSEIERADRLHQQGRVPEELQPSLGEPPAPVGIASGGPPDSE